MTDETSCTALSKIDGKYAKRVSSCCDEHDEAYDEAGRQRWGRRLLTFWRRPVADFKWGRCAWRKIDPDWDWLDVIWHRVKTVFFTACLMLLGAALYHNVIDWFVDRFTWARRIKEWLR